MLDGAGDVRKVVELDDARTILSQAQVGGSPEGSEPGVEVVLENGAVRIEPLNSRHTIFVFLTAPTPIIDGDLLLLGTQVVRYRDLRSDSATYFGATAAAIGSQLPGPDVAVLEQLRPDGRVRDTLHLWAGRSVLIGREEGDWVFSWDATMSARHAEVRCDMDGSVTVRDVGSRNGVGRWARGPQIIPLGQRFSLGGQLVRVDRA
ncbi:MAG: FHA domain-containing protein [Gemmatimonadota bacterium]